MAVNKEEQKKLSALRRRRKLRQMLGAVICVLVLFGIGSIVTSGINVVEYLLDDTNERLDYENRISTLVAFDPVPFENLDVADKNLLVGACVWRVLDMESEEILNSLSVDETTGGVLVPLQLIEKYVKELYGSNFVYNFETFTSNDMQYVYLEDVASYQLPVTGLTGTYYPQVVDIKKESSSVKRVTVAYLSVFSESGNFTATPDLTPKKYYDYLFTKQDDGKYYLTGIVDSETKVEVKEETSGDSSQNQHLYDTNDATALDGTKNDEFAEVEIPDDATIGSSNDVTIGSSEDGE